MALNNKYIVSTYEGGENMNYLVHDHTKRGKVFATLEEANAYRSDLIAATGRVYLITETKRQVTHIYHA